MMRYDFETSVNRAGTGARKWNRMRMINPKVKEGVVPFSVADMELKNAPEIAEGLSEYLKTAILGYTIGTDSFYEAVQNWMERRHGWKTKRDWFVHTAGIINALYHGVNAFSKEGEGVIIMTPVYYPFYSAVEKKHRRVVMSPLINREGHYEIDFDDLEEKAKDPRNTLMLLCSPHNPVGRVWTKEELTRIGEICLRNHVFVICDEIHHDLIMPGYHHTVFASISEEFAANTMTCTAPSKTFNLAGMQCSNCFVADEKRREAILASMAENAQNNRLNVLGFKACEIVYTRCEPWLEELILVLDRNRKLLTEFMEERMPKVKVTNMEGTYLQWMDFREYGIGHKELERIMQQEAQVFFDEGYEFGKEGEGFERMNLACPTWVMEAALKRVEETMRKY